MSFEVEDDQRNLEPQACIHCHVTVINVCSLLQTLRFRVPNNAAESILDFVCRHRCDSDGEILAEIRKNISYLLHLTVEIRTRKQFGKISNRKVLLLIINRHETGKMPEGPNRSIGYSLFLKNNDVKFGCNLLNAKTSAPSLYHQIRCPKLLRENNCRSIKDMTKAPRIYVLAGVNGAGKSSIAGAVFRNFGGNYYNPDELARRLRASNSAMSQFEADSLAWQQGRRLLERAIANRLDFAFETTLGGTTITALLCNAALVGFAIHVWYVGLASAELHMARMWARVALGGHDISEADIRRRYESSRLNLIHLMPHLTALKIYDNSLETVIAAGKVLVLKLVLHMEKGKVRRVRRFHKTPDWAKPIVAKAINM